MKFDVFKGWSLKTKLTLFTLIVFLIGMWSLAFYTIQMLRVDLQRLLGEQQLSTASLVAADIDRELGLRLKSLEKMAARMPAVQSNTETLQEFLGNHPLLHDLFNGGLFVAGADGTAIASVPRSVNRNGINYLERDYFKSAFQEGKTTIGKPVISKKLHTPVIAMATPVRNSQGNPVGVLVGAVDLGKPNFLDKITEPRYGKTGGYKLVAPQHKMFVTGTDKKLIFQPIPVPGIDPLFDRYAKGFEGSGITNSRGVEELSSAKHIAVAGWFVVATIPTEEAFAPIYHMQQRMLLAAIILTLLASGLMWWMLRRQLLPVFATIKTLAELSESEQAVQPLPIAMQDEVGQLIGGFNRLLGKLARREKKLIESEERYRTVLHTALDGYWLTDMQGRIIEANQAYSHMVGYSEQELLTMRISDLEAIMTAEEVSAQMQKIIACGYDRFDSKHRNKNGNLIDVEISIQYRSGEGGQFVVFLRDITGRKRSEALRHMGRDILLALNRAATLESALKYVNGLVKSATGVDAVGIRLQEGNDFPYFCHEGFSDGFLEKESSLRGVCHDDCGNISLECTCGLVISGKTDSSFPYFTSGGSFWTNDSFKLLLLAAEKAPRIQPRNECIHQDFASIALIPIRAKGDVVGLLQLNDRRKGCFTVEEIETLEDTAKNIGEAMLRKQAEEKLLASEQFLRMLTDHLPGMVAYWTDDLHCKFFNTSYLEWFGKTPEQLTGITLPELFGEDLFRQNESHIRGVLRGEPQHFERTLVKPTGESSQTWTHYIPDTFDGITRGYFVLVSDVTELKQAEGENLKLEGQLLQAQKMESVGRLAGGVAHDFNNMLTIILGFAHLALLDLTPDQPLHGKITEICKAAERSAGLTRQLLAFARKQKIAPKVLNLNHTIGGTLNMLQRLLGEHIHLNWHPASDLWQVNMDPSQIDQILANLCVNSHDAIADVGSITIETGNCTFDSDYCAANPESHPGEYVLLSVSDDGIGMDKKTLAQIFEPFFTTKGVGEGTGLGLATAYGIVKQNNGFITVYSEPGKGTTFRIHLPRHVGNEKMELTDEIVKPVSGGQETILVVEDEPSILSFIRMFLGKQGYTVLAANTPDEATLLAKKHEGQIRLLMTDVIMPEMNGRDLAGNLTALYPHLKTLFMSGYTANYGVLDEGVNFLQKPFSAQQLTSKVREVLDCNQEGV